MHEIIPAILVDSAQEFERRLRLVEPYVTTVQIDVLDGSKHDRTSFYDPEFIGSLATTVSFELHLMVENPLLIAEQWKPLVPTFKRAIFHAELDRDHEAITRHLRQMGLEVGIALNPETPLEEMRHDLQDIDELLLMSVHPGASGQGIGDPIHGISETEIFEKIRVAHAKYPHLVLGCDGGVTKNNIQSFREAGTTRFCVGSAIFASTAPVDALHMLQKLVV